MEGIKVGEYVRTKDGRIEKIKIINKYTTIIMKDSGDDTFLPEINWYAESGREVNKEDIKIHSSNIIDLIEERRLCKWKENRCNYRFRLEM